MKNKEIKKLKIGDKVRFKNKKGIEGIFYVYGIYDKEHVSLSLKGYPDVEQNILTHTRDLKLIKIK